MGLRANTASDIMNPHISRDAFSDGIKEENK